MPWQWLLEHYFILDHPRRRNLFIPHRGTPNNSFNGQREGRPPAMPWLCSNASALTKLQSELLMEAFRARPEFSLLQLLACLHRLSPSGLQAARPRSGHLPRCKRAVLERPRHKSEVYTACFILVPAGNGRTQNCSSITNV